MKGSGGASVGLGAGSVPMTAVCAALERLAPDAIRALELRVNELEASWLWLTQRGPLQLTANC